MASLVAGKCCGHNFQRDRQFRNNPSLLYFQRGAAAHWHIRTMQHPRAKQAGASNDTEHTGMVLLLCQMHMLQRNFTQNK